MVKRKFEEIWVEEPEVREADIDPGSAEVVEDCTIVADEVAAQEVPAIEKFWQLLEAAGYECW